MLKVSLEVSSQTYTHCSLVHNIFLYIYIFLLISTLIMCIVFITISGRLNKYGSGQYKSIKIAIIV